MNPPIRHVPESHRFETVVENETCVLDYQLEERSMTMSRVWVPSPVEGRGIASRLTRFALDHCREKGLGVRPRCPYVAAWIQRHPDYADLVVQDG
jgi:predicted GNAT family acetyltransferase